MPGPPDTGSIGTIVPVVVAGSAVTVPAVVVVVVVVVGITVTVLGSELVGSGGGGSYGFKIVPSRGTPVAVPPVVGAGIGVIVPQLSGEYVHEFLDDQRSVGFRLVQELSQTRFLYQTDPPDRDYFNVGVGVTMVLANGFQPFISFRELVGYDDRTSHSVSVGLRIPF